jgi:hypothetical protein
MVMNPPRQAQTMLKLSTARVGIANPTCQGNQEFSIGMEVVAISFQSRGRKHRDSS